MSGFAQLPSSVHDLGVPTLPNIDAPVAISTLPGLDPHTHVPQPPQQPEPAAAHAPPLHTPMVTDAGISTIHNVRAGSVRCSWRAQKGLLLTRLSLHAALARDIQG